MLYAFKLSVVSSDPLLYNLIGFGIRFQCMSVTISAYTCILRSYSRAQTMYSLHVHVGMYAVTSRRQSAITRHQLRRALRTSIYRCPVFERLGARLWMQETNYHNYHVRMYNCITNSDRGKPTPTQITSLNIVDRELHSA